jgi:hypothetical protein
MTLELVNVSTGEVVEYDPDQFVSHSQQLARRLDDVVRQQHLDVDIQGKRYLRVEAWQFLAGAVQMTPRTREMIEIRDENGIILGFRCYVELVRDADGMVLGGAFGRCDLKERIGRSGAFAAESMAQTRATSKAISQKLRFIPVLAGYQGTPIEEMPAERLEPRPPRPLPKGRKVQNAAADAHEDPEMDAAFVSPELDSAVRASRPEGVGAEKVSEPAEKTPGRHPGGANPPPPAPSGEPAWLDEKLPVAGEWGNRTFRWLMLGTPPGAPPKPGGARWRWASGLLERDSLNAKLRQKLEIALMTMDENAKNRGDHGDTSKS